VVEVIQSNLPKERFRKMKIVSNQNEMMINKVILFMVKNNNKKKQSKKNYWARTNQNRAEEKQKTKESTINREYKMKCQK
jgi:hypothetical protein